MDKLAWSRSLNPSWCLSCRKVKRLLKPQFWLHLFTLLHLGACCLLLTEERVAQRARAWWLLSSDSGFIADLSLLMAKPFHPVPSQHAQKSCVPSELGEWLDLC